MTCDLGIDFSSDDHYQIPSNAKKITLCVSVYDKHTGLPIDSAEVKLSIMRNDQSGFGATLTPRTESSGYYCFEYWNYYIIRYLLATKESYEELYINSNFDDDIELSHLAYLKLHIENIEPYSSDDSLQIEIPNKGGIWRSWKSFSGGPIDTIVTYGVQPNDSYISWQSWHDGVKFESEKYEISLSSLDTTFFKVQY